jgi:PAS domain S-box-containing protein
MKSASGKTNNDYGLVTGWYTLAIENALDMVFIHNSDGKITYVNETGIKESGYSQEELLNMNPIQLVPPEYFKILEEIQIKRLSGSMEVFFYEMEYLKKNGGRIPVWVSSSPLIKDGRLDGVIHIVRNISEIKKAERLLSLQTELASKLCQINEMDLVLEAALNTALEIGDVDCGGIYLLDEENSEFKLECFKNISDETLAFFQKIDGKFKFAKGPLFINGNDSTNPIPNELFDVLRHKEKLKFFFVMPFYYMGNLLGSLNIGSHEKDEIPELSKKILFTISQEMGGVVSRIRYEEALKKSENKYRQIVESANSIIFKFDKGGKILSMNEYGMSFFGYKEEEIIGKTVYETIIPEYESTGRSLRTLAYEIYQDEEKYKININENIKKNGDRVWIYWANKPIRDNNGNLIAVLAVGNDITEQKKLEEAIKASEVKFKTLFEKAYEPIFILDKEFFVKDTNNSSVVLFQYPKEKIIGRSIYELIAPLETKRLQHIFRHKFENSSISMETNFMKKNGQIFPAEFNLMSLELEGEKSLICAIRDITEQRRKEEDLKKQILKYELSEGNLYLSKEQSNLLPFEAFRELVDIGYKGILLSRNEKDNFDIEDIEFDYFWLSSRNGPNTTSPDTETLREFVSNLKNKNVILIDSIDYIIVKNGFNEVYNFVSELREIAYFGNNIIIISVDKDTIDSGQLKLLEKEAKPILLKSMDILNNRMLDMVSYIYNQNKLGANPSYSSIGKELAMTRPTVRKNVRFLEANKYVAVHRKGRNKKLEITEKGKKML